jgi:ketosteroid isomerase-like protein
MGLLLPPEWIGSDITSGVARDVISGVARNVTFGIARNIISVVAQNVTSGVARDVTSGFAEAVQPAQAVDVFAAVTELFVVVDVDGRDVHARQADRDKNPRPPTGHLTIERLPTLSTFSAEVRTRPETSFSFQVAKICISSDDGSLRGWQIRVTQFSPFK